MRACRRAIKRNRTLPPSDRRSRPAPPAPPPPSFSRPLQVPAPARFVRGPGAANLSPRAPFSSLLPTARNAAPSVDAAAAGTASAATTAPNILPADRLQGAFLAVEGYEGPLLRRRPTCASTWGVWVWDIEQREAPRQVMVRVFRRLLQNPVELVISGAHAVEIAETRLVQSSCHRHKDPSEFEESGSVGALRSGRAGTTMSSGRISLLLLSVSSAAEPESLTPPPPSPRPASPPQSEAYSSSEPAAVGPTSPYASPKASRGLLSTFVSPAKALAKVAWESSSHASDVIGP